MNQLPIRPPGHPGQQRVAGPVHLHRDGWLPRLPHPRHLWPQRLWLRLLPQWKHQVSYRWFCALSCWLLCWHQGDVGYLIIIISSSSSSTWCITLIWRVQHHGNAFFCGQLECDVLLQQQLLSLFKHMPWVIKCLVFTGLFFFTYHIDMIMKAHLQREGTRSSCTIE